MRCGACEKRPPPPHGAWRWQTRGTLVSDDIAEGVRGVVSWLDFSDQKFFQEFNRDFNLTSTRSVKEGEPQCLAMDIAKRRRAVRTRDTVGQFRAGLGRPQPCADILRLLDPVQQVAARHGNGWVHSVGDPFGKSQHQSCLRA